MAERPFYLLAPSKKIRQDWAIEGITQDIARGIGSLVSPRSYSFSYSKNFQISQITLGISTPNLWSSLTAGFLEAGAALPNGILFRVLTGSTEDFALYCNPIKENSDILMAFPYQDLRQLPASPWSINNRLSYHCFFSKDSSQFISLTPDQSLELLVQDDLNSLIPNCNMFCIIFGHEQ